MKYGGGPPASPKASQPGWTPQTRAMAPRMARSGTAVDFHRLAELGDSDSPPVSAATRRTISTFEMVDAPSRISKYLTAKR